MKNLISKILIAGCNLLYASSGNSQNWSSLTSGTMSNLLAVQFVDANNGFASGDAGTVLKTTDGGTTWTSVNIATTYPVQNISFINTMEGWAVAGDPEGFAWNTSGSLWKTVNGGTSWTQQIFQGSVYAGISVKFLNSTDGWIGFTHDITSSPMGNNIYFTTDGGTSLTANPSIADWLLTYDIDLYNMSKGWAVSNDQYKGYIIGISNVSANWTITTATLPFLYGIDFINDTNGFAVGDKGTIMATTDGGTSWTNQTSGTTIALNEVAFDNKNMGFVCGDAGTILKTIDAGTTWTPQVLGTTQNLNGIFSVNIGNSFIAWAVGDTGTILKTTAPVGIINNNESKIAMNLYPNPFSDNATLIINDKVGYGGSFTVVVYDLSGKEIKRMQVSQNKKGIIITRDGLPHGTYIISLLHQGKEVAQQQMIIY